ncbi:MAG: hypothetical protein DVB29_00745 [Verrucomicrobia bacterium]|jgi:hypothetical protein|nr:MAG: hypothetical protein DVB29_00745 [Verrucomicrobiota bacterium]MDH4470648.1 YtcA family lipoprotein [Verrucomicrobiae bacterium]
MLAIIKFSGDPLINVAGAYFPAWLACMFVGILGTWFLGILSHRLECSSVLEPHIVMIPAIFSAITLWTWLLFFAAR